MANDLPSRWARKNGAIYYRVPENQKSHWDNKSWFRLGENVAEAFRVWNQRVHGQIDESTIRVSQLMDQWVIEHANNPAKVRPATTRQHLSSLKRLRPVFGDMNIAEIKRSHLIQYHEKRWETVKTSAKKEIETMSSFFSWCLNRDLLQYNPASRLGLAKPQPRDHYVEDLDVKTFMQFAGDLLQRYIPLKMHTGARKNDLLSLHNYDWREEGLFIGDRKSHRVKDGRRKIGLLFKRTAKLESIMDMVLADQGQEFIFESSKNKPYLNFERDVTEGFNTVWTNAKKRALKSGEMMQCFDEKKPFYVDYNKARALKIPLIFQDRDLRAKTATDSPTIIDAQNRLGHSSSNTTRSVYNRKPLLIDRDED